ncbi:MAG TPA: NADH-quinone oxidoreductase subunit NuoG [Thiobacillaceae bacterium]|nr:NADH-quinone oxidoreductase subunit NuoG [Thiobacillaceae bacterium]
MPVITIDDRQIEVAPGDTVMDAAHRAGIYIPHFCYHKKLSIAASCRMCLVEVEKVPKPLPACATPATDGMVVRTHSDKAVTAQKGVMEFLLINHPLDCPICDQGGECMLQDIAVGYGGIASRYAEPKRVVKEKDLGPLVATDMTRCIHCSRCVRFGQEIAGIMELGMPGRGEHTEVMPFLESQVTSELSGNVIDLCPVGALTSKPFRYSARPWELSRRKSVSPHDGLGSNLAVHVKDGKVFRFLPLENEAVNECWLADRDRYSYQALNSEERVTRPMVRQGSDWVEVDWQKALAQAAGALKVIHDTHGGEAIGFLASPHQTLEELYLTRQLAGALGCENIDTRLDVADFSADGKLAGIPWLGMPVADLDKLDRVLLVGSSVRKEQPLIAQRLRQAVKRGARLNVVHAADDDLLCRVANKLIAKPSAWVNALAQIANALRESGKDVGAVASDVSGVAVSDAARRVAESLVSGERKAVFLGGLASQHPNAAQLHSLAQAIAQATGAALGFLVSAANQVGAALAGCRPGANGRNAQRMLAEPRKAYVLLGVEPTLDHEPAAQAESALESAELVVLLTAFKVKAMDYAHVVLPIAPFTETAGAFVNMEGRLQAFNGVVPPQGEARPAWKVLRVLGNQLQLSDFDYDSAESVRKAALPEGEDGIAARLDNGICALPVTHLQAGDGVERLGETPIYQLDPLVRRAPALQATQVAADAAVCWANGALIQRLGLSVDRPVRVVQDSGESVLKLGRDDRLPEDVVRVAACHRLTTRLGERFGALRLEKM